MAVRTDEGRRDGFRRLGGLALLLVVLGGAFLGARQLADWVGGLGGVSDVTAPPDLQPGLEVSVDIPAGSTARQIGVLLAEAGVVESAARFELAARTTDSAERLQAGRYDLETGMANDTVIDRLLTGPMIETFRITVREGLWINEVLDEIAGQTDFTTAEVRQALSGVESSLLEGPASDPISWEGLLFPDTYDFPLDADPEEILQRLADTMVRRVETVDWSELESRGLSVYEGIIVASLIEAEAGVDGDRPLIASVVVNRLDLPMVLGIDATVIYAVGQRGKSLTQSDLDIDSPYNTRKFAGLPPTPIGGPGRASLEAAASPAATDFLYYVLTSATGAHSFTASYDEFLALKQQALNDGLIP
ncbi:MAG: endolytic transglycosylase MltG [Acidimicrobiia bacterium]|nr:endolytic transglycosylase MltG [Acidimicrobiia bacterium]